MVEQQKLVGEKNALIETVKKLNREVVKLEHFKRSLLSQLQDHGDHDVEDSDVAHDVVGDRLIDSVLTSVASIQRPGERWILVWSMEGLGEAVCAEWELGIC